MNQFLGLSLPHPLWVWALPAVARPGVLIRSPRYFSDDPLGGPQLAPSRGSSLGERSATRSRSRRWMHFPTLLWLNHSDATPLALPIAGGLVRGCSEARGQPRGLLGCYLIYLSIDKVMPSSLGTACSSSSPSSGRRF